MIKDQPIFSVNPETGMAVLESDFRIHVKTGKRGFIHLVTGFTWNGMSIPSVAWQMVGCPFAPKNVIPGLIHDFLYAFGYDMGVSRKEADKIMKELLLRNGKSRTRTWMMYQAVRRFGMFHYNKG